MHQRDDGASTAEIPPFEIYLQKSLAALAGAEVELAHGLHNNAVNRAYYAAYQAAVAALVADGVEPEMERFWPHDLVQLQFPLLLIDRRKRYPRKLRSTLKVLFDERLKADYEPDLASAATAAEAVTRARTFVEHVSAALNPR
jgi:uncharacterized protein (UPF0332 family)